MLLIQGYISYCKCHVSSNISHRLEELDSILSTINKDTSDTQCLAGISSTL